MTNLRCITRYTLILSLFLWSACSGVNNIKHKDLEQQVELYEVTIDVTQTSDYCGGARPTDEILKELNTPKPLSNTKIFIWEGEINDIDKPILYELTTDANGKINKQLPAGDYSVVFSDKKDQSTFNDLLEKYGEPTDDFGAIDKNCLEEYFKKPALTFSISTYSTKKFNINYVNRCRRASVPCAVFKGPVPPSAPPKK